LGIPRSPRWKRRAEVTEMNSPFGREVEQEAAADWVRGSFAQGSSLAMLMSQRLGALPNAILLAPGRPPGPVILDDYSRGVRTGEADRAAQRLLELLGLETVKTLIVEDENARPGARHLGKLGPNVGFVEDRVFRWTDLNDGALPAATLLRKGSSGYPLNAFGCWAPAEDLGLSPGHTLSVTEQLGIVDATVLVIVSLYDGEAYLALVAAELRPPLD
jgi:hypothetical protein